MPDEQTPPESNFSQVHNNFLARVAQSSKEGFSLFRELEALANDAVDLGYLGGAISPDSANGRLNGLDPADVDLAVGAIAQLGALLDANDGAFRKAFKRLAQYAA